MGPATCKPNALPPAFSLLFGYRSDLENKPPNFGSFNLNPQKQKKMNAVIFSTAAS